MSGIDDRESGFENKYAHDQELDFKANARRNKLLGLWAAELMGLDFEEAGDDDVFRKVRADLDAKKVELSDHLLRKRMDELLAEARHQIQTES